jgi:peptidoglycan/xylan/chitin deacetylase (PgdA/CDA1 family)
LVIALGFFAVSWLSDSLRRLAGKDASPGWVVLCYHDISPENRARFARQMDVLLRHSKPIPLDSELPLPRGSRYVSISFDDGMSSFIDQALPEIGKRNLPVTLFVVSGKLGQKTDWAYYTDTPCPIMTSAQLCAIADRVSIGSHTVTHPLLTLLSEADARRELEESRADLGRVLGRVITTFSFPYGEFDEKLGRWCSEAGYKRVFTMDPSLVSSGVEPFVVGRVGADPTDWPLEFRLKLAGAYRWLPYAFSLKRKVRRMFHIGKAPDRND